MTHPNRYAASRLGSLAGQVFDRQRHDAADWRAATLPACDRIGRDTQRLSKLGLGEVEFCADGAKLVGGHLQLVSIAVAGNDALRVAILDAVDLGRIICRQGRRLVHRFAQIHHANRGRVNHISVFVCHLVSPLAQHRNILCASSEAVNRKILRSQNYFQEAA